MISFQYVMIKDEVHSRNDSYSNIVHGYGLHLLKRNHLGRVTLSPQAPSKFNRKKEASFAM
ncbi:hypothetical protein GBA52_024149 [Prunus armeniaca]|nr:hypothetical protein GBA52_024149 [Prunus armeniaca]